MANIKVRDKGETWIEWEIYNLSNSAKDYDEFRVDVSGRPSLYWTSINTTTSTYKTMTGLTGGTSYTGYGYAKWQGTWYSTGSVSVTTDAPVNPRPSNWSWYSSKNSGSNFSLTANEWNNFTDRINEFRVYKGYSTVSFTYVYSGNIVRASYFNEAKNAIGAMNATGISNRYVGDEILASHLNTLRDRLNEL